MAAHNSIVFLPTTLFLIIGKSPLAHANLLTDLNNIAQVQILGRVVYSVTGNPIPGTPTVGIPNVPVTLSCNGTSTNVTQFLTNPTGIFTFIVGALDALLFDPSNYTIKANLPLVNCTILPPTGNLQPAISFTSFIQTSLGLVANFATQLFSIVGV